MKNFIRLREGEVRFGQPRRHEKWWVSACAIVLSVFICGSNAHAQVNFTVSEFVVIGNNPLAESATQRVLQPYTGEQNGIARLREAAAVFEEALQQAEHNFHRVVLPQQVLKNGAVKLEVLQLIVGDVTTSGNKHFSDANLIRSLPQLKPGKTPNTKALSRALAVANFNTAKRTRLTFGRGTKPDTLDARIEVRDRRPDQVYAWLNNTGSARSNRARLGVGYQHRNVFDRDHNLTATYSTAPEDTSSVRQYGVNYQIPVYRTTGLLSLFRIESDFDTGRVADVFDVSGGGETTGISYSQILNKHGDFRQRVYVDVVDKLFDNDIDFSGSEIGIDLRSRPLSLNYQVEWTKPRISGRVNLGYAMNLNGGDFNNDTAYGQSRAGAEQDWSAFRLNASFDYALPRRWGLSLNLNAQQSDEPLISGEQLGLGGTVGPRGFEERETSVDRGLSSRIQLWAPPSKNDLRFGGFVDHGFGDLHNIEAGEVDDVSLTSVGISAKWQWRGKLVFSADLGHIISGFDEREDLSQDGDNRLHLSLVYRFF